MISQSRHTSYMTFMHYEIVFLCCSLFCCVSVTVKIQIRDHLERTINIFVGVVGLHCFPDVFVNV